MKKSLTEYIDHFISIFPSMTKEEVDYIENILSWDNDKKAAFIFAKSIFESDDD